MQVSCPICTGEKSVVSAAKLVDYEYGVVPARDFQYRRCLECDSEFQYPRPSESELGDFYPETYHAYHEDHGAVASVLVSMRSKGRAKFYKNLIGNGKGNLFDVGTGDCRHFDALKEHCDLTFSGVELKPEIALKARQRGYDVAEGTLESMDVSKIVGTKDIVSMNHLVEHVVEPRILLEKAFDLLKPGGFVIGQLPTNSSWERQLFGKCWAGYHFPRHLQAISREGMAKMLTDAGFEDVKVISAPHLQTAISLQNWLIEKGWKPEMKFGKSPIYSLLLLAVAPFESLAWMFGRTGIIDFQARKPLGNAKADNRSLVGSAAAKS